MADKYKVAAKRTLRARRELFPAGKEVDAEMLGLKKKDFDKLIEDGTIIVVKDGRKSASKQSAPKAPDYSGGAA